MWYRGRMRPAALALLLLAACVPRPMVPEADRRQATEVLAGQARWLKVTAALRPFYGDPKRLLLTDRPAAEVEPVEGPDGQPLPLPPAERTVPPGTPFVVEGIQFPTGLVVAERPAASPRLRPWVLGRLPGEDRQVVLVLPSWADSLASVMAAVGRVLAFDDLGPRFAALPAAQRAAILRNEPADGMGRLALTMAWGEPDLVIVQQPVGSEEWRWSGGRRRAFLQDQRLVRWEPR